MYGSEGVNIFQISDYRVLGMFQKKMFSFTSTILESEIVALKDFRWISLKMKI